MEDRLVFLEILRYLRPGDTINIDGKTEWWKFWVKIAHWGIRFFQKKLFGSLNNWRDTHTMLYFDNDHIFSVEPPKTKYCKVKDLAGLDISIYRYTGKKISKKGLEVMKDAADKMIGTKYDRGQLLSIAFNQILGYPYKEKNYMFDFGSKYKVCSVGNGVCYRAFTKAFKLPKLFSKINPVFADDLHKKYHDKVSKRGWDVENYYPALFANSHMFDDEFILMLRIKDNQVVYRNKYTP